MDTTAVTTPEKPVLHLLCGKIASGKFYNEFNACFWHEADQATELKVRCERIAEVHS